MQKLWKPVILLVILSGLAWWLYQYNRNVQSGGINMPDRDFTVTNTDDIQKIFIAFRDGETLTFTREGKSWIINRQYKADDAVMIHLINVFGKMKMLYIPPKPAVKNIVESIGKNGIKVELYDRKDKKMKVFYVGTDTQAGDGTHMILEGYAQPYVMHLPGLLGGLRSRFEQPLRNYRDKAVFEYKPEEISEITAVYHKDMNSSFHLTRKGNSFDIKPVDPLTPPIKAPVNMMRVNTYLSGFERVAAESIVNENKGRDSILSLVPFCTFTLKDIQGNIKECTFHVYDDILIGDTKTRTVKDMQDIDRFFLNVKGGDFYLAQRRVFSRIMPEYRYFFEANPVK